MNFHVYVDEELGKEIQLLCIIKHKKRNSIIREALRLYIQQQKESVWPDSVLSFKGVNDFPPFESYREELHEESHRSFLE